MSPQTPSVRVAALVVAAGAGRRMGFDKVVAPLVGRPVVAWSMEALEKCPDVDVGVVVCAGHRIEEFRRIASEFPKFRLVVAGGTERVHSVLNGLAALRDAAPDFVAVHDGARPLLTPSMAGAVIGSAIECGAAVLAEPVSDTLHRAVGNQTLSETVRRDQLWAMQTPQVARFGDLIGALKAAMASGRVVTDEVSALIAHGIRPHAVAHKDFNFKVTWPRDLTLAAAVLAARQASSAPGS